MIQSILLFLINPNILGLILILFTFIYVYLRFKIFRYWKRMGVYQEKPHLFFGSLKDVFNGKCTENEIYNKIYFNMGNEKLAGCYYFWKPSLLIKDPDLIKRIMVTDFDSFTDHPSFSNFKKTDRSIWSLFTMEGKIWKSRRVFFTSLFTPRKIKDYFKGIEKHLELLLEYFNDKAIKNDEIKLDDITSKYLINVITNTLFGIKTDSVENPNSKFVECGEYITAPSTLTLIKINMKLLMPHLYEKLRLQTVPAKIWQCFYPFVKDIVEYRENNNILQDDLIGHMIRQKNNHTSGPEMTLEEMVGHVYAFFEAGFDSTSLTIAYCLFELSRIPDVQEKLRNEVDVIMKERRRGLTYEALADMEYMDKVVKEILRKYPPSGIIRRVCTKDYMLGKIQIKEGTQILIPVEALHYDPSYFSEPELFNPDRHNIHPFTYLPFGAGPRICIGMKLAELAVKIGLLKILSKFIISPSELHKEPIEYDPKTIFISIRPKNGIWVKVSHRI